MLPDKYASLAALMEREEKHAYRIHCLNRLSPGTIIAPHGGFIEPGTSALARAIAGRKYNLFDFQGLRHPGAAELHVTATRFREPRLCTLLDNSSFAVSLHSMGYRGSPTIWLGGLNHQLKQAMLEQLRRRHFDVDPDSPMYRGESPHNVINLTKHRGIQLEISHEQLSALFDGAPFFSNGDRAQTTIRGAQFISSIRQALQRYAAAAA